MPTYLNEQEIEGLRRRDAPAFAPVDAVATEDGKVWFDGWCGMEGTTRTPQQALRFAAYVRQAAVEAQRNLDGEQP